MSYPQGFVFPPSVSLALRSCPSLGSRVVMGPRTEERGSAFAPYSGTAPSPGFTSHLPYGGEPRAAAGISAFMSPGFDPSSAMSGPLDFHPFGALGPPYPYADPAYRKNATRDATATLKAWLAEHRKNPYPTKGEKIMLAIVTKMTLTQVSTWFANARRRLKKENKMTWTPRNRSEDEEDDDNNELERHDDDDDHAIKTDDHTECRSSSGGGGSCVLMFGGGGAGDGDGDDDEDDDEDHSFTHLGKQRLVPGPTPHRIAAIRPSEAELASCPPSKEGVDSCDGIQGPNPAPKPKLWSLAEIATSADKSKSCDSAQTPLPHGPSLSRSPALPRHLYYASPFIPTYSGYSPLGPPHASPPHL